MHAGVHPALPATATLAPATSCCSLEGDEFETDEENLAAWQQAFRQRHYWAVDVGPATFIGLSTVRFRRCVPEPPLACAPARPHPGICSPIAGVRGTTCTDIGRASYA